jgi:hypothetical protein
MGQQREFRMAKAALFTSGDKSAVGRLERQFRLLFPDGTFTSVKVLQYGDDPGVEPGDVAIRAFLPRADRAAGREEDEQVLEAFHDANNATIEQMRDKLPRFVGWIEFHPEHPDQTDDRHGGPVMRLQQSSPRASALDTGAEDIVSVMTRLGAADLAVVDTLITAGIASSRAEALRWAVGRIRENPAYGQLQQRVDEINELKNQF